MKNTLRYREKFRIYFLIINAFGPCTYRLRVIKMPQLITVMYLRFQSQKRMWPQTMADSMVDWELSRGMIGACVSKLRVVSWITIDWQNSQPPHAYRKWVGNGAKRRDPRFRSDHKARREYCTCQNTYCSCWICLLTCVCISIPGRGRQGTPLCFTRRFTSRLGGRFISTLMSQLEAAGICPFSGRGSGTCAVPECPLRGSSLTLWFRSPSRGAL